MLLRNVEIETTVQNSGEVARRNFECTPVPPEAIPDAWTSGFRLQALVASPVFQLDVPSRDIAPALLHLSFAGRAIDKSNVGPAEGATLGLPEGSRDGEMVNSWVGRLAVLKGSPTEEM